jgi:hypothetical protein
MAERLAARGAERKSASSSENAGEVGARRGGLAQNPERNPTERRTGRASSVGARMVEAGIYAGEAISFI